VVRRPADDVLEAVYLSRARNTVVDDDIVDGSLRRVGGTAETCIPLAQRSRRALPLERDSGHMRAQFGHSALPIDESPRLGKPQAERRKGLSSDQDGNRVARVLSG
jgi:hypothetical protein